MSDREVFDGIVERRRSYRAFGPEPMPEEALRHALHLATLSANSSNIQSWEFHWVRHPELKARVAEACMSQPGAVSAPDLIVLVWRRTKYRANARFMYDYIDKNLPTDTPTNKRKQRLAYYARLMPLLYWTDWLGLKGLATGLWMQIRGLYTPSYRQTSKASIRVMGHRSLALASQTLMLAITAAGYDTLAMEGIDTLRIKRALGLKNCEIGFVLAVGKGLPQGLYGPRIRVPDEQVIFRY